MSRLSDADELGAWRGLPAAIVSDAMGRVGAMDGGISRLSGSSVVGRAYPVSTAAADNSTIHRALEAAPRSTLLVVDAEGHLGRAVWGKVLTVAAQHRGLAGAIIDGVVRDIEDVRELGSPCTHVGYAPPVHTRALAGSTVGGLNAAAFQSRSTIS